MLKVEITLCPYGSEEAKKVLHTIYIANVGGRGTSGFGYSYKAWIDNDPRGKDPKPRSLALVIHDRRMGSVNLLAEVLNHLLELYGPDNLTDTGLATIATTSNQEMKNEK